MGVDTGIGFTYDLELLDACLLSVLTIDPAIFDPRPVTYILEQAVATRTLTDSFISETEIVANCPTTFEYTMNKIDGTVFEALYPAQFDPTSNTLLIETSDRSWLS